MGNQISIEAFNTKFEIYSGNNKSYSETKYLIDLIIASNFNNEKSQVGIVTVGFSEGYYYPKYCNFNDTTGTEKIEKYKLDSSKKYNITIYYNEGIFNY